MSKTEQSAPATRLQPPRVSEGLRRRGRRHGAGRRPRAWRPSGKTSRRSSRGLTTITLDVNGQEQKVEVEPRTTLLEVLRYGLNLTGAKPISVDGSSGGSTVLVDGKPVSANTMLALDCVGKKIQTVESLGGAKLDPCPRPSCITTPCSAASARPAS